MSRGRDERSAFAAAVDHLRTGDALGLRALLAAGAPPDAAVGLDQTVLHFAAYGGHAEVVEALLAAGTRRDVLERQFGRTAAEWARETGEDGLAQRLEQT